MREAAIWLQTDAPAKVQILYWPKNAPDKEKKTDLYQTTAKNAYTAELVARNLLPGTTYEYTVIVDDNPLNLDYTTEFQTPPFYKERFPPPDLRVAIAGGNYVNDAPFDPPNRIPGDSHAVFLAIEAKNPDLMIWVGNNTYLREPDWGSRSGAISRYTKNRALPELQPLLASTNHVATWSTHDFGPVGADRLSKSRLHAREAFDLFWANPPLGVEGIDGISTSFQWSDVEFFILDDRTDRDLTQRISSKRKILGDAQLRWLVESLKRSTATFKIIIMGSPILNPADDPANYKMAETERDALLEEIKIASIDGVLFVTGGKAHGELTKMVRANAPDIYDLTVGPATGRPADNTRELNYFREPGTSVFQRHFALLDFTGPENARQVTLSIFDVNGTRLWSDTLTASEMRF